MAPECASADLGARIPFPPGIGPFDGGSMNDMEQLQAALLRFPACASGELESILPSKEACWDYWPAPAEPAEVKSADLDMAKLWASIPAGDEPAKVHLTGAGSANGAKQLLFAEPCPAALDDPSWTAGALPMDLPAKVPILAGGAGDAAICEEALKQVLEATSGLLGAIAAQDPAGFAEQGELDDAYAQFQDCRWHSSAKTVGVVSADGHVFTKTDTGGKKVIMSSRGTPVELSTICMVFDASLRCGGIHRYNYHIIDGELGAADGVGFVFDKQVRRNNIQRMRSVFLNQRGRICLRDNGHVCKLRAQLPPLAVGMWLTLHIDLDTMCLQFAVFGPEGQLNGVADVCLQGMLANASGEVPRSGFFCAIVTKDISVALT